MIAILLINGRKIDIIDKIKLPINREVEPIATVFLIPTSPITKELTAPNPEIAINDMSVSFTILSASEIWAKAG